MLKAKVKSTSIQKNRAGVEIMTVVAEVRKDQNVTAEWLNSLGEAATPVIGEWVIVVPQSQSFGGHFAFAYIDVLNFLFADRGAKIIFGRDSQGAIKTKLSLTGVEFIIENSEGANFSSLKDSLVLNQGSGSAVEVSRLQTALDAFSNIILAEFGRVAAGTLPNPSAPYVPSGELPADISSAKSETVLLP